MVQKILICGSGNGGHVLAGLLGSRPDIETRVLSLFSSEIHLWTNKLQVESLTLVYTGEDGRDVETKSRPDLVFNDPAQVVPGADVILITVPAFAHQTYLEAIEPYITSPTLLVALPGQPGFEFQSSSILKKKLPFITILSTQSLPWACRIEVYARRVRIIGTKKALNVAYISKSPEEMLDPIRTLQSIFGPGILLTITDNCLDFNLTFAVVHPGLMYGKWKNWNGQPIKDIPAFYQGVDEEQISLINDMDKEILTTFNVIKSQTNRITFKGYKTILRSLTDMYGDSIKDKSSLRNALATNTAYKGLLHPMKSVQDRYVPDFSYRYLSEDISYGLVVVKGLAVLAGVDTPTIDKVIQWAQEKLDKEYIVGRELRGGNLHETRAPQVYRLASIDDLDRFFALS